MGEAQAPGVGEVLGAAGPCPEIEWGGRVWKVAHPVQKAKAILEEYLAAEAVAETESLERLLPAATYAKAFADCLAAIRGKHYRTWGPGWLKAIEGPDGNLLFLLSLLRVHQPAATIDDARALLANRPLAVAAALERVSPDFFAALAATLPTPEPDKAQRAAEMHARFLTGLRALTGSNS